MTSKRPITKLMIDTESTLWSMDHGFDNHAQQERSDRIISNATTALLKIGGNTIRLSRDTAEIVPPAWNHDYVAVAREGMGTKAYGCIRPIFD